MLHNIKKRNEGFTIIEVLIVLAIAGLILVIVFLAVPALQRNQRNTARKSDASRVATAASTFVSNNGGANPATGADALAILKEAGTLGQLSSVTLGSTTVAANTLAINTTPGAATDNELVLGVGKSCSFSGGSASFGAGSTRQMALIYPIEQSGNTFIWGCLDV